MTTHIDTLIDDVLQKEGGYVDHVADRGGPTNLGITQATLSAYLGRPASVDEVRDLDVATAHAIYAANYYRKPKIDQLPEAIQPFCFDSAVNHGPGRAIRFVQHVCNETGVATLAEDGAMGPRTAAAARQCLDRQGIDGMLTALVQERQRFYHAIVANDESQGVFLKGWLARADSFLPGQNDRLV
jgi:lysozyme family protein